MSTPSKHENAPNPQKKLTLKRESRILADMKPLHELLAEWQDMLKITNADAARLCGLDRQQWFELKSGRTTDPRARTLIKLSVGTNIPLERLVASCGHPALDAVSVG